MGAYTFLTSSTGNTAQEAFDAAVDQACYECGHGGYTGTIAEKDQFTMCGKVDDMEAARELADKMIEKGDPRIADKWGPAGCFEITSEPGTYLFFGWASA